MLLLVSECMAIMPIPPAKGIAPEVENCDQSISGHVITAGNATLTS